MSESTSSAYPSTYIDLQPGTTERLATSYRRFSDLRSKGPSVMESNDILTYNALFPQQDDNCPECATSPQCQDTACPVAEITSQCTDQCVVVACTDPAHSQMSCHDPQHCDITCGEAVNCTDCNGFEEFLQCCTDYHAYFSQERLHPAPQWDGTMYNAPCDCQNPESDVPGYPNIAPIQGGTPTYPTAGQSNTLSDSPAPSTSLTFAPSSSSDYTQQPLDVLNLLPPGLAPPTSHACMWDGCAASFDSLSELVGHVNLQHLRITSTSPSTSNTLTDPNALPPSFQQPPSRTENISCHWGNCDRYPSLDAIPGPSSSACNYEVAMNIIASHLLQDHLGLHGDIALPSRPIPEEMTVEDTPLNSLPTPPDSSSSSTDSPEPSPHECGGTHACRWQSCSQTFSSCDELTAHITSVHIGAGKAEYECFWEGCKRNGEQGFSSKQKICRHLQSHTGHRPFQCKICKQNFSEAATLQQHMRRHTQEKPYICDFPGCGKSFAITGALTIHKRTHNGYKPFKCTYCEKAFAESSNLSKHLRTHTGDRPYPCQETGCGKAFARPDQLARHMSIHRKKTISNSGK